MKKHGAISITILISAVIFFSLYYLKIHGNMELAESTLQKSFRCSGAKVVNSEVYVWSDIRGIREPEKKLGLLTRDLMSAFKVIQDKSLSENTYENDLIHKVEINGFSENYSRVVHIGYQSQKTAGSRGEGHISFRITQDLSSDGLEEIRKKALEVFNKHKVEPRISSCITGTYDGKLGYNELNRVSLEVFNAAEARKVEGTRDEKLISVSAYSPSIEHYIKVNDKKVNLNLAVRYNAYEDKTYIWLATPVITTEY